MRFCGQKRNTEDLATVLCYGILKDMVAHGKNSVLVRGKVSVKEPGEILM